MSGKDIARAVAREVERLARAHPEYGQKRLAAELAARGIEVDPVRLRRLLKEMRGAPRRPQRWAESPLDPSTWRHPPPRYLG